MYLNMHSRLESLQKDVETLNKETDLFRSVAMRNKDATFRQGLIKHLSDGLREIINKCNTMLEKINENPSKAFEPTDY